MSKTLREAERVIGFAKTAFEIDGEPWNKDNQIKYQALMEVYILSNGFYMKCY